MTAHYKVSPHEKGVRNYTWSVINIYIHINTCPVRMQAYENKTLHMLDKTIDNEPVCVCILRILITQDEILPFSNYNVRICIYYKNSWLT
jgi:hypothetical protein